MTAGGGILSCARTKAQQDNGSHLILGGLFIQLIFFGFFVVVTALFHKRINKNPTATSAILTVPWKRLLFVLYGASIFIMIRSLYRIIEYADGSTGSIASHEAYFYVFDSMFMFFTMILFNVYHPSQIINKDTMSKDEWTGQSGVAMGGNSDDSLNMDSSNMGPRVMA